MSYIHARAAWDLDLKTLLREQGWGDGERVVRPPVLKLVLACVADHANREAGEFWVSVGTISRETGLDERTVRSALAKLVRLRVIERVARSTQRRPATYRVLLSRVETEPTVERRPAAGGCSGLRAGDEPRILTPYPGAWPGDQQRETGRDAQRRAGRLPTDPGSRSTGGGGDH